MNEFKKLKLSQDFEESNLEAEYIFKMMNDLIKEVRFIDKTVVYGSGAFWSLLISQFQLIKSVNIFDAIILVALITFIVLSLKSFILLRSYFKLKKKFKFNKKIKSNNFSSKFKDFLDDWILFFCIYGVILSSNVLIYIYSNEIFTLIFSKTINAA